MLDAPPSSFSASVSNASSSSNNPVIVSTVPFTGNTSASLTGNLATTTASLTAAGFSIIFDDTRSGALFGNSGSGLDTRFHVTADSLYSVTGNFSLQDTNNVSGDSGLSVRLWEIVGTSNLVPVFDFGNDSRQTANPAFTVGHATGDYAPGTSSTGSQTGTLLAGHSYQFDVQAYTNSPTANQGGRGIGGVTFDVAAVPEPGCISIAACAVALLSRFRRDRSVSR